MHFCDNFSSHSHSTCRVLSVFLIWHSNPHFELQPKKRLRSVNCTQNPDQESISETDRDTGNSNQHRHGLVSHERANTPNCLQPLAANSSDADWRERERRFNSPYLLTGEVFSFRDYFRFGILTPSKLFPTILPDQVQVFMPLPCVQVWRGGRRRGYPRSYPITWSLLVCMLNSSCLLVQNQLSSLWKHFVHTLYTFTKCCCGFSFPCMRDPDMDLFPAKHSSIGFFNQTQKPAKAEQQAIDWFVCCL